MAYRLTEKRLAALRTAAEHPKGSIDARTVSKADELALEALGLAASIDDCGHVQDTDDPEGAHRSHPHFFRITDAGRRAAESAGTDTGGGPDHMPSTDTSGRRTEAKLAEELHKAPPAVELVSFGYLHGAPPEAHLVVDMREHFRDPHVTPALRELTADHEPVMRAVLDTEGVRELAAGIRAAVDAFRAGPSGGTVRVAVGCAGGRHRSAAMVNYLAMQWHGDEVSVATQHRDIHRPVVER
ncbi:hypothetical protein ACIBQ5_35755 [Streptomyces massasporeus]|uniref:RapZ C-terminal domain-containing protein n=1 Tax=Streptomyces massasporeus TaxID=67324 RepID=UPI0037B90197